MSKPVVELPRMYTEFAEWWPLLSSPADYAAEAEHHWRMIARHARRPMATILELGCGGGNNASHLKKRFRLMLCDVSPPMLAVSKRLNPECEHVEGDMRTLRLRDGDGAQRIFDAVFIHDAIVYMTTEEDLRRAMQTAFDHCAPGGVAMFVPDYVRETWIASTGHAGHDGPDGRAARYLDWTWDPDPGDTEFIVEIVYIFRSPEGCVRVEHDRHRFGLFPIDTWLRLLRECGFLPTVEACEYPGAERARCFVGVRPEHVWHEPA